jgi:hypothetical protein
MALPEDFSPVEHFQDIVKLTVNKMVLQEFSDVGDDSWERDISTPRASLRTACTHQEVDTMELTLGRLFLLYFTLRKARDIHHPVYGNPIDGEQETRKFKPQVLMYFLEDYHPDMAPYSPVSGEIRFRLMNESSQTLSSSDLINLANKIKAEFGSANGFLWRKGKSLYHYEDSKLGYKFQLLANSETEAKRVISSTMELRAHTPNWALLSFGGSVEPSVTYPTVPPTETILAKPRKMPRKRPIATVRFQYALLHVHGIPRPICLYDRTHFLPTALVR